MKKILGVLMALAATVAFGEDLLISFSTPGPDKYADGSTVLDGERYALYHTATDGTMTEVITVAAAKDGACVPVLFVIDEAHAAQYQGGTFGVYLLDTRDFAKDATGKTLAALNAQGKPAVINVKAAVSDGIARSSSQLVSAVAQAGVAAGAFDLKEVPQPEIKGIEIVGAKVVVTVGNTVPFVGYTLATSDDVTAFEVPAGAIPANGQVGGDIKLVTDKAEGGQFFKVTTVQ